jgi:hypothetical protein
MKRNPFTGSFNKRQRPLSRCRNCGQTYSKSAPNQRYCEDCSFYHRYYGGLVMKALYFAEPRLKAAADLSGNPKVWTAGECSQEFLRSLIPRS